MRWRDSTRRGERVGPDIFVGYYVDGPNGPPGRAISTADRAATRREAQRCRLRLHQSVQLDSRKRFRRFSRGGARTRHCRHRPRRTVGRTQAGIRVRPGDGGARRGISVHALRPPRRLDAVWRSGRLDQAIRCICPSQPIGVCWNRSAMGKATGGRYPTRAARSRFLDPIWHTRWRNRDYVRRQGSLDARVAFLKRFTKVLSDSGVPLLAGTDSPTIPGLFPGSSIVDDLTLLVEAGLTPYQALTAATRTPGEFLAKYARGSGRTGHSCGGESG